MTVLTLDPSRKKNDPEQKTELEKFDFDTLAKKNRESAERLRKERERANRDVLKSYRIKN